jgi:hypothetical protein
MQKIHVLGVPRSGSNYIFSMIAKRIEPKSSLLYPDRFALNHRLYHSEPIEKRLHLISQSVNDVVKSNSVLTKTHPGHLFYLSENNLLDKFKSANFYNIITIRRDLVQSSISHARSYTTTEWFKYDVSTKPIIVPREHLLRSINIIVTSLIQIIDNTFDIKYDEIVYYEDLSGNSDLDIKQLKIGKLINFGAPKNNMVEPDISPNKKETILNYDELVKISLEYFENFKDKRLPIINGMANIKI